MKLTAVVLLFIMGCAPEPAKRVAQVIEGEKIYSMDSFEWLDDTLIAEDGTSCSYRSLYRDDDHFLLQRTSSATLVGRMVRCDWHPVEAQR